MRAFSLRHCRKDMADPAPETPCSWWSAYREIPFTAGRLVARRGARLPLSIGGLLLAAGALLLIPLGNGTAMGYLLAADLVFGLGAGMISPSIATTAVAGTPADQAASPAPSPPARVSSAPRSGSRWSVRS